MACTRKGTAGGRARLVAGWIAVIAAFGLAPAAQPETLRLQLGAKNAWYPKGYEGIEETALWRGRPDDNFGAFWEFQAGATEDGGLFRGVMRWDLEGLAPLFESERYTVVLCELKLGLWYNRDRTEQAFELLRILPANADWVEGNLPGKPGPGTATWNAAQSGTQPWAGAAGCGKPGMDYEPAPLARFESDTATHMRPRYLTPIPLPVDVVRSWALAPERNAGILIKAADEAAAGSVNFIPSEHTRSDYGWDRHHPELVVTYIDREAQGASRPGELISDGKSGYIVVIPDEPAGSERYAAEEFVEHLRSLSGHAFTVLPEALYAKDYGPAVSIGRTALSTAVLPDAALDALGDEGYVIDQRDGNLFIVGGRRRGALYGVYDFLEGQGIRWYTPKFTRIPERPTIPLPTERREIVPKFFYRDQLWNNGSTAEWRTRMRLNGEYARIPDTAGGSTKVMCGCHSYHALVPPSLYGEHPEWFAVKEDGKRAQGMLKGVQLCTTNPELRAHILAKVRADLAANPAVEQYWVSQDDGFRSGCFCPACEAERRRYGSPDRWAANTISLANYVAEGIRSEFPHVKIKTLAYSYTVDAPEDLPVADNVLVVLCGPPCTFHPYDKCRASKRYRENLLKWAAIAGNIQTYFYGGPNYGYFWPYPSWFAMCSDYPNAYRDGVRAVYRQGAAVGYGSEFTELRGYLSARMAWEPERDIMGEITDFTDAYYGPGAEAIRAYLSWYDAYVGRKNIHPEGTWGDARAWEHWVDKRVVREGDRFFHEALAATAGQPEYHERIEAAYLPILFVKVMRGIWDEPQVRGDDYVLLKPAFEAELREAAGLFTEVMARTGYNRWNEPVPYEPEDNPIAALGKRHKVYTLDNGRDRAFVLPSLGGRIIRWDVGALGGNVFNLPNSRVDGYPFAGGYEEYSQFSRSSPGIAVDFEVAAFTDNRRIELRATLKNGLALKRIIELAADTAELRIVSEYTNATDKPVAVTVRTHPEFSYGTFRRSNLYFQGNDGAWKCYALSSRKTPMGERSFPAEELAGDVWLFGDPARNWGLANRIEPHRIQTLYAFWGKREQAMNLELWGRRQELAPGDTETLDHAYVFIEDLQAYLAADGRDAPAAEAGN
ncbi:MAG: DUF4838 domain-containing protein [Candidatus Hydrogenedentes bacterium]|nr:DUF4838 domain-containing protein [Candidatus Hydrogenedentota bacterium]